MNWKKDGPKQAEEVDDANEVHINLHLHTCNYTLLAYRSQAQ